MRKQKDGFGAVIKKAREERKLSLREVEKEAGISYAYLHQLESGKRGIPKIEVLYALSKLYGLPVETMLASKTDSQRPDFEILLGDKKILIEVKTRVEENIQKKTIKYLCQVFTQLNNENKKKTIEYMEFLLKKQDKENRI